MSEAVSFTIQNRCLLWFQKEFAETCYTECLLKEVQFAVPLGIKPCPTTFLWIKMAWNSNKDTQKRKNTSPYEVLLLSTFFLFLPLLFFVMSLLPVLPLLLPLLLPPITRWWGGWGGGCLGGCLRGVWGVWHLRFRQCKISSCTSFVLI